MQDYNDFQLSNFLNILIPMIFMGMITFKENETSYYIDVLGMNLNGK
jgi:hypothetical protein